MSMFRVTLALALAGCVVLSTPHVLAQSAADVATARQLFKEASELAKEEKWEQARDLLRRALALKPAPMIHFSLAIAEQHTGKLVEALENFRAFLASPPDPRTEGYREPARSAVTQLESQVGRARIHIRPNGLGGLEVSIDDKPVPREALTRPRLVNPGKHLLEATAPGFYRASTSFEVPAGGETAVELVLKNDPDYQSPSSTNGRDRTPLQPEDEFPVVPVTLMSIGGAALVAGIAVGVVALDEAKHAPASEGPEADRALRKGIAADVLYGVGGATAAVGLIMLVVEVSGDDREEASAIVRPWSNANVAGVELRF